MEKDNLFFGILHAVTTFSILIPFATGIIRYRRLNGTLKILAWFIFIAVLFEVLLTYIGAKGINNLAIMNVFVIIQYLFFSWVFYRAFNSYIIRKGIVAALICFTAFALLNLFLLQGVKQFNSWSLGLMCLLLMCTALLFFYEVFKEGKVQRLERYPMFWVASAALLYFAGCFFLFIFSNYALAESNELLYAEWSIHSVINIVANLCYAIGLWLSQVN